jgi:hypothetical protein
LFIVVAKVRGVLGLGLCGRRAPQDKFDLRKRAKFVLQSHNTYFVLKQVHVF